MTVRPGANWVSTESSGCSVSIGWPSIATMTSPSLMPALSAGPFGTTPGWVAPLVSGPPST